MYRVLCIVITFVLWVPISHAQAAQEIIAQHVKAIGGEARWRALRYLKAETNFILKGRPPIYLRENFLVIHQLGLRLESKRGVNTTVYIVNQQGGWSSLPGQARYAAMDEQQYQQMRPMLDLQPVFIDYAQKGHKFLLKKKKKKVHGRLCYVLVGMLQDGSKMTYYIDQENHRLVQKERRVARDTQTISYEDYREIKGYLFPYKELTKIGNLISERVIQNIVVNERIDIKLFDRTE